MKKIFAIILLSIFLLSSINVVGLNINKKNEENNDIAKSLQTTSTTVNVDVGRININENSVWFEDIEDKTVWIPSNGVTLNITARAHFCLWGWCDHGYAYLGFWNGALKDSCDWGDDCNYFILNFAIDNVNIGDEFEIQLRGDYEDCLNDDLSKTKKVTLSVKEDIESDLWPIEAWISTAEEDWDKEHVVTRTVAGDSEDLYVHLRYNILYSKDKPIPRYYNRFSLLTPLLRSTIVIKTRGVELSLGTGDAKEERLCVKFSGDCFLDKAFYSVSIILDCVSIDSFPYDAINESNESNNFISVDLRAGARSKPMSFELFLPNLFDRFPFLKQFLR